MPFRLDDLSTLPADLQKDYGYMIKVCRNNLRGCRDEQRKPKYSVGQAKAQATPMPEDMRIAYLTVQESVVNEGESQRRSGLHTEGFAYLPFEAGKQECVRERVWEPWGYGDALHGEFTGGIFMASDVDDSTHVYNCRVPEILVGAGGDVEHLRPILNEIMPLSAKARYEDGAGDTIGSAHLIEGGVQRVLWPISLQAEQLFWMTDHTPHESRPLEKGQHRCYFRLVTGRVGACFIESCFQDPTKFSTDEEEVEQELLRMGVYNATFDTSVKDQANRAGDFEDTDVLENETAVQLDNGGEARFKKGAFNAYKNERNRKLHADPWDSEITDKSYALHLIVPHPTVAPLAFPFAEVTCKVTREALVIGNIPFAAKPTSYVSLSVVLHTAVAWQTVNELACGESGIVHGAECIAVLNGVA
ncbi:hypothetical protein EMIHUDRAFT_225607 [Emiliania huxleyi CCMP1516]|uniref:Uncharacterized protein n=2 Tax=Emiliania huxleyi TaxID=2903 RepID=A0A0D3KNT9_EMIH1|nr:hypothetical protein EMIHUDRAFT_225607 [Emiliania huxleyi CCMP1516]EOD37424.1 hypothetical protein EMIHUDRAFT_225607 [Emiliania huxleyi CCMP1516]|eukprot:XP_005789853.1 hypothetical protein EMIHUDRAFT_225607 [Emiliania huxleyi CCMP1516]